MHLVFPSALLPHVQGDAMSLLLGAYQIHVVGDEELASAGYSGAPRWHERGGAKVGGPIVALQLEERKNKTCVLSAPDGGNRVWEPTWEIQSKIYWGNFPGLLFWNEEERDAK